MNSAELKAIRIKRGRSMTDMAKAIGVTRDSYAKKESGRRGFKSEQIITVAAELNMSAQMVNLIFFDGMLPQE